MFYYKFTADTPFAGTRERIYESFEENPSDDYLISIADDLAQNQADSFEYLVFGCNSSPEDEGITQEEWDAEIEDFRADCYCYFEEITEEEYNENT